METYYIVQFNNGGYYNGTKPDFSKRVEPKLYSTRKQANQGRATAMKTWGQAGVVTQVTLIVQTTETTKE